MKNKINLTTIPKEWIRFQRNLVPPPKCEGCNTTKCTVLYDSHHDEYFSMNCGTVIMEQGQYKLPYDIDYTYTTTQRKKGKMKRKH